MDCTRRKLFHHMTRGLAAAQWIGGAGIASLAAASQVSSKIDTAKLAMPGPYRGKVIAVEHSGSIVGDAYQPEPVQQMLSRGMMELTGAPDAVAAWKVFVQPGDVVGIKLNPVGRPHVISDASIVREVIAMVRAAGVGAKDIVVYDRYKREFYAAGFDKWLPDGARIGYAAEQYDEVQQAIEGYDPDHYMDMALTLPGQSMSSLSARRSYASLYITKQVNKLINLPLLKDHQSAGITMALKNLSHGLVNNVNRSHSTSSLNACGAFIPAVVSMPVIRNKAVLHILDGVKGLYHGGPSSANRKQFVWPHHTMYFATDPVAMDHVCWRVLDEKRVSVGMKPVAEDLPDRYSTFVRRQPEHVEIAGAMGLGEWDWNKIQLKHVKLA